jgi:uncharacterized protein (DUF302 family)
MGQEVIMEQTAVALTVTANLSYEKAVEKTRELLAEEGFGIMTEIDVRKALKEKLDLEFKPYVILGACNPKLAHEALSAQEEVGVLLPCNVVVSAHGEKARIMAFDPEAGLALLGNGKLKPLGVEVKNRLTRVLDRLASA